MKKKNDNVTKNEQIRNTLNVSIIMNLKKFVKKNDLKLFVFQYDI